MMLSMLSSAKEKNRFAPMRKDIDKRCNGYKRRQESLRKSTDVLVEMVGMAKTVGTTARHLLLDIWFAFPGTIRWIKSLGIDTICMFKDTPKVTPRDLTRGRQDTVKAFREAHQVLLAFLL